MKKLGGKSIGAVTILHKLVALVWVASVIAVLVLVVPMAHSSAGGAGSVWASVGTLGSVASTSSVVMLLIGLVYGIWTPWGFIRNRWVIAKWVLFLLATGAGGPSISAAVAHSTGAVIALTAVELVALLAAGGIGIFLDRSWRSRRPATQ
jgi:hypothetical protein